MNKFFRFMQLVAKEPLDAGRIIIVLVALFLVVMFIPQEKNTQKISPPTLEALKEKI